MALLSASITPTNLVTTSGAATLTNKTFSDNPTFSGGTANGVPYLNGSKVLTSGSALTFDGTNFIVGGGGGLARFNVSNNGSGGFEINPDGTASGPALTAYNRGSSTFLQMTCNALNHVWSNSSTEGMRLTSTGLGIGTSSPSAKLDVAGSAYVRGDSTDATFTSAGQLAIKRSTSDPVLSFHANAGSQIGNIQMQASGTCSISVAVAQPLAFNVNGSERARISSAGELLLGTTSDNGYKFTTYSTTSAQMLYLRSGAVGDAGTAMIRLMKSDSTNTTSQIFIQFLIDANNTNSGQINANGASQAAFGSFSDVRLKENIENLPNQLNNIMALRPVEFDYKNGSGHQIGFIAQEMEQVYPDAIGVGDDEMLTVTGWSKTEARLVKAIQEQQAIIESLKARLDAANL